MSDYNELYQQIILEHNKNPRHFKKLDAPDGTSILSSLGKNPLCGDHYYVSVELDGEGKIKDIGFQGDGCAISKASASLMSTRVLGKSKKEAIEMRNEFQKMLTGTLPPEHHLGKLTILEGVKEYPARVKCATLCWHTLAAALEGETETTTE